MMRKLYFLLLWLPFALAAQEKAPTDIPRLTLKSNVAPLLNPYKQAFALSTDIRLAPKFSLDVGAGRFLYSNTFGGQPGESYTGWRLRGGLKYYLHTSPTEAFHIGLEGKYHDIRNVQVETVLRQGGQYWETLQYDRKVRTQGLALRMGFQAHFGKKNDFVLEPFFGFGMAVHDVSIHLPPDAESINEDGWLFNFEYEPGQTRTLDVLLGINLGWCIW